MVHVTELKRLPQPRWTVDISNDPQSGLKRKVKAWDLDLKSDKVVLKCRVHWHDSNDNELRGIRFTPYELNLVATIDMEGPFINPSTGEKVLPDEEGYLPDGTIFRYDAIMSMCGTQSVIDVNVINFITSADINGEFNI